MSPSAALDPQLCVALYRTMARIHAADGLMGSLPADGRGCGSQRC
jgi:hypothetical protein